MKVITALTGHTDPRRYGEPVLLVVHHTGSFSLASALQELGRRKLSYHYVIEQDGLVWKLAPVAEAARHAGVCERADGRIRPVNQRSIGVAWVGGVTESWRPTTWQMGALQELAAELRRGTPSLRYVAGHKDLTRRKVDPRSVDVEELARITGLEAWRRETA
ncbi:MAG: N-acetylmuramoyl-L-alanine amidase [Acidobacteriia bacterium]|nr:N-acetylmuramoyl-L-alanine amidase [Terriglobia bacterium]